MTTQRYDKVLAGPPPPPRRNRPIEAPGADTTSGPHAALPGAAETLCGRQVVTVMPGNPDDAILTAFGCQICRRRMHAKV